MASESVSELAAARVRSALRDAHLPRRIHLLWSNTPDSREVLAACASRDAAVRLLVKLYPDAQLRGELWHANDRLMWIEPREVLA
jgi:hypothetical protein